MALTTYLLQTAPPADGPASMQATWIVLILVGGLVLGIGLTFLFLYLSGRMVATKAEAGIRTVGDVANTTLDRSAQVITTGIETAGDLTRDTAKAIGEGAGSLGRAMGQYLKNRNSHTIYTAILEARASFEITTCKMNSIVYHKLEKKSWNKSKALVEVMPVEISYGFDLEAFKPEDIEVHEDGAHLIISLPPLQILSLQKGTPNTVYTNMKNVSLEEVRVCQEGLDQRMRDLARSSKSLSIAEELSRNSFQQVLKFLFLLVDEEHRPKRLEIQVRPREHYRLALPKPIELESHHLPHDNVGDEENEEKE